MIIYKVTTPNDSIYIGLTSKTLKIRKSGHIRMARSKSNRRLFLNPLHRAILKHGNNLKWETIDTEKSYDLLKLLEIKYISSYKKTRNMLNCTIGGDGTLGYSHTDETKLKMKALKKDYIPWNKGLKGVQTAWNKGATWKTSTKLKMSASRGGKPFIASRDGKHFKFNTFSEAELHLSLNKSAIHACLKNTRKTHKGYTFKYEEVS